MNERNTTTEKRFITQDGMNALVHEIETKKQKRKEIITNIGIYAARGDLSENAEYSAEKEKHAMNEKSLAELEDILATSKILDLSLIKNCSKVSFGLMVSLTDLEDQSNRIYQIVSQYESDVSKNMLSIESPLAQSLVGKGAGDIVEVSLPKGKKSYIITSIDLPNN